MATATVMGARPRWTAERRFYTGIAIAMALVAYIGFARSFFLRPFFPEWPAPAEPIFVVHGALQRLMCQWRQGGNERRSGSPSWMSSSQVRKRKARCRKW